LAARHDFRADILLHDGGDVADWRSLAGVVEIRRPVNNPPPVEECQREKCRRRDSTRAVIMFYRSYVLV